MKQWHLREKNHSLFSNRGLFFDLDYIYFVAGNKRDKKNLK